MRVAYISDLHLEFRKKFSVVPQMPVDSGEDIFFPNTLDADVLIIAGDVHPDDGVRQHLKIKLEELYGVPVIMPKGNHDYWYDIFNDSGVSVTEVKGVRIASTTLWTHLDPELFLLARGFSDFRFIEGMTLDGWNNAHRIALEGLTAASADIVVTHHAPSYRSVSEGFRGSDLNPFFVNHLDRFVELIAPKVWIHGHVHSKWDYMIEETRVLCNPLGYPGEVKHKVDIAYFDI